MDNKFLRTISLIGEENFAKIQKSKVLVVGLGGVGSYAAEAIARSGVLNISIVDNDVVDSTNINRQLIALESTIGGKKTEIVKKRLKEINSEIHVNAYDLFLTPDNIETIFTDQIDYVIDAIDNMSAKIALWKYCLNHNIEFISSLGTAKKLNAQDLYITTLDKTENDPMAKALRQIARKNELSLKIPVVFSKELPFNKSSELLGSMMFVPASAGILCANYIIKKIIDLDNK